MNQVNRPGYRPVIPSRLLYLTEPARAAVDIGLLVGAAPLLGNLPRGDGHPVLVLPGLGAADSATLVLRRVLRRLGYRVHGWGLGTNFGPTPRVRDGIAARLDALSARYQVPISVIGWSLGGLYARELAWRRTESVRQVITLGSPLRLATGTADQADPVATDMSDFPQWPRWTEWARWYGDYQSAINETRGESGPLPVPATAIYSVVDGIVGWQVCLDDNATCRQAEYIAIRASHIAFAYHPAAVYAIADRLAQPAGDWHPFEPPALLRAAYPKS